MRLQGLPTMTLRPLADARQLEADERHGIGWTAANPKDPHLEAAPELADALNYAVDFHQVKFPDPRLDQARAEVARRLEDAYQAVWALQRRTAELLSAPPPAEAAAQ